MSTTFGVLKPGTVLPEEKDINRSNSIFIEVAFRYYGGIKRGTIYLWKNELAPLLPDDMKVYPLDNTAHGIETIGDLKKMKPDYDE